MATRLSQRATLVLKAETANQESKQLDFKGQFEDTTECWCALMKDIIAMANSGGGILVFGANSDGTPSGVDCNALLKCDLAAISSKAFKWTGYEFAELETVVVRRWSSVKLTCQSLLVSQVNGRNQTEKRKRSSPKAPFTFGMAQRAPPAPEQISANGSSVTLPLASAECRLPKSLHFSESDAIIGVVRARSVHKVGYGHNCDWAAA
jgi:hypothetical protein